MHWIDENEKIKEWVRKNYSEEIRKRCFGGGNIENTYWYDYDNSENIMEYVFETIPELKCLLEKQIKEVYLQDIITVIAIETFKCRNISNNEKDDVEDTKLPDFVYVF